MEDCTNEEKEAIQELKDRLRNEVTNDLYEDKTIFYRFLKANDFNVSSAEKVLREHLELRKKLDLKNVYEMKIPEVLETYLPLVKLGYDKEGCLVRYCPAGNVDWIGINASCKLDEQKRQMIFICEQDRLEMIQQSKKLGKVLDKVTYIHNFENFSFAQATDKKVALNMIQLLNVYQANYPESLKNIIIINASVYFSFLFAILKRFLPTSILQIVKVYSDDNYKEDLQKLIDADVLPAFLGGNRTDPDGNSLCLSFINQAGPVPEKYYIHRSKRSLSSEPGVEKITLSRASFHEVVLEVKEPECYLEWEFETESRDTGFGLYYEDGEESKTEIVPLQRINTDEYSESGIYKCENTGTYIVVFDNTYSILRSKVVYYRIKILTSKEFH